MTGEHRADLALRALAELQVPELADARQRRQVIDRLEQLQREPSRAMPRQRWLRLSAAALALVGLAAGALLVLREAPESPAQSAVRSAPAPAKLAPIERAIPRGSEVKTEPGSTVQLKTALGAKISVAGSSELRLLGNEVSAGVERVDLALGSINVKVPKLGRKRQFRVSTPDTLVIVHGTEFSVTVRKDEQGRTNTSVEVTSGRVEVRKQQAVEFLDAGAAWSSGESAAAAVPSPPEPSVRPKASGAPARVAEAPRGNLAQANALLASALEASRRGNDTLALTRLDELLRRYPESPVADNARVERFRTLRRLGRDQEAARAASKYLKGDPDGFARDEARELEK